MGNSLIGKDVTAYTVQGQGFNNANGNASAGPTFNLIGSWKDIEITVSMDWVDRSPSSADWKVQRRTTRNFKGTAKNLVDSGLGSSGLILPLAGDQVILTFTTIDGASCTVFAGITEGGITAGKDGLDDSLSFEGIGLYNGGDPITYDGY